MDTLIRYLAVAVGGALGAVLRYYISLTGLTRIAAPFPTATFVINITGSFVVGFFLTLVTERIHVSPHLRLAIAAGFVGAYTTFATFEYETASLVEGRNYLYAFLYVVLSFTVGFAAVYGGIITARKIEEREQVISRAALHKSEEPVQLDNLAPRSQAERPAEGSSIETRGDERREPAG